MNKIDYCFVLLLSLFGSVSGEMLVGDIIHDAHVQVLKCEEQLIRINSTRAGQLLHDEHTKNDHLPNLLNARQRGVEDWLQAEL